jgi:hypothetical protein
VKLFLVMCLIYILDFQKDSAKLADEVGGGSLTGIPIVGDSSG